MDLESKNWEMRNLRRPGCPQMSPYHRPRLNHVRLEEGVEEAMGIWLVTQMSHHFLYSPNGSYPHQRSYSSSRSKNPSRVHGLRE
jgi:hypothetical protein